MYQKLKADPGKITILAVGPLTNVAQLLTKHPDAKAMIKRIVIMGGCVRTSEAGKPAIAEWNIKLDPQAAQVVFTSGIPLVVAPLDSTYDLKLDAAGRKKSSAPAPSSTSRCKTSTSSGTRKRRSFTMCWPSPSASPRSSARWKTSI